MLINVATLEKQFVQCVGHKNVENTILHRYKLHVGDKGRFKPNTYTLVTKLSNSNNISAQDYAKAIV